MIKKMLNLNKIDWPDIHTYVGLSDFTRKFVNLKIWCNTYITWKEKVKSFDRFTIAIFNRLTIAIFNRLTIAIFNQ